MKKIFLILVSVGMLLMSCEDGAEAPINAQGKGGSLARFALASGYLYVVDNANINVFQIQNDGSVNKTNYVEVGFGVETIFARDGYLFLGAKDAMHIYSISNPQTPTFVASHNHFVSCDPVVVSGSYAYVTLRVNNCRASGHDALEVLDISNIQYPTLIQSYAVESPYGLGIDDHTLFLCEGSNGLKIFDVTDPSNIQLIKHDKRYNAYDVIPHQKTLFLTGSNGIYQFDYSDLSNIKELSQIPVE